MTLSYAIYEQAETHGADGSSLQESLASSSKALIVGIKSSLSESVLQRSVSFLSPVMQMVEYNTGVQTALQNWLTTQNAERAPADGSARHINVQTSTGTRSSMVAGLKRLHSWIGI